ncbi:hypothetical protein BKI52_33155 [marine bacterium AO1-C]|nr:hypothetical protein BKI52_33155 [marine bacterium AO1-C]
MQKTKIKIRGIGVGQTRFFQPVKPIAFIVIGLFNFLAMTQNNISIKKPDLKNSFFPLQTKEHADKIALAFHNEQKAFAKVRSQKEAFWTKITDIKGSEAEPIFIAVVDNNLIATPDLQLNDVIEFGTRKITQVITI